MTEKLVNIELKEDYLKLGKVNNVSKIKMVKILPNHISRDLKRNIHSFLPNGS